MRTIFKLVFAAAFVLCAYSFVDAQTLCTESRCYKLQDELGFYIDSGNPLSTQTGVQTGALIPCNENRCVKLVDKDGNYITINNPLPTTGGGGGGTTIPSFTGIVVQTSSGVFAGRTIVAGSAKLTCTNNDGVGGNMTCDLGSVASTDLTDTVKIVLTDTAQSITGTKTFAAGALKGTDAWLTNGLKDNNGNFVLHTTATANAADYLDCTNAATGNPATITCSAVGTDSNINIAFVPKGTGSLISGTGSPTATVNAGEVDLTAKAAPSTPSSGIGAVYVDSTSKNLAIKNDAGTINHGVQTTTCSNQFASAVSDAGAVTCTTVTLAGAQFANQGTTTTVLHGNGVGNPSFASVTGSDMAANTVTSTQMAVVNTRRVCDIAVGDTSGSAITNAQLGPQKRICYVPFAATIVEMDVAADGGTPNVIVAVNHAGSNSNIVSSALATASSGGIACSKTTSTTGIDGATTCTNTLQNTSIAAGDYLELVSGTAGGTAKLMTIHVIYTIN